MRKMSYMIICLLLALTSCDVHEWPDTPGYVKLHLRLNYETKMMKWEHTYDGNEVNEVGLGEIYDNHLDYGKIRYVIRTYPMSAKQRTTADYKQQFVFVKDIAEGYDHEVTLDLLPGSYNIMVWSDLMQENLGGYFYDASDFSEIRLQDTHGGNTDYRDAFKGNSTIALASSIMEQMPDTLEIQMQRPLAKYEFVTNDVLEFISKEITRITSLGIGNKSKEQAHTKVVDLNDYKVVFHYVGFMPDAYSIYTDEPVDSSTGVIFESGLKTLTESEATLGFDYVFSYSSESVVSVQIGIYDNEGTQISLTAPINIPLKRSHHTIMTGSFLMSQTSGGVSINPEYDGDHNLIFP